MQKGNPESEAYQRILATARDLFYSQGYRATGINEIIKKSGVAKATFYAHFPSKSDLALAYVKSMNETDGNDVLESIDKYDTPYEKLLGLFKFTIPWSQERDYRGCAYLNLASEITDHVDPVRQESKNHYETFRSLVASLIEALKKERGAAWKNRDVKKMTDDFMLLFSGALAMAQVYHDKQPFLDGLEAARRLLA